MICRVKTISKYCVLNISYFMYSIDMRRAGAAQAADPSVAGGFTRCSVSFVPSTLIQLSDNSISTYGSFISPDAWTDRPPCKCFP